MERRLFGSFLALLFLALLFAVAAASAQITNDLPRTETIVAPQSDFPDLGPLPIQLAEQQTQALRALQQTGPRVSQVRHHRGWHSHGSLNHPLTPRDVAFREVVYRHNEHKNPHQFVHVRLKDGRIWTGAITGSGTSGFVVKTGIMGGYHSVAYRDLAEEPREVAAVGTHLVHGLEWTGVVVGCIAAIPLAVVFYPLLAAGVTQD